MSHGGKRSGAGRPRKHRRRTSIPLYMDQTEHDVLMVFMKFMSENSSSTVGASTVAKDLLFAWLSRQTHKNRSSFLLWINENESDLTKEHSSEGVAEAKRRAKG